MIEYGNEGDITSWMELVNKVKTNFPGLETDNNIQEHKQTVLRFMKEKRAICVKDNNKVIGVLLFSKKHNMICCLAVLPEYRKRGFASELLETAIKNLDRTRNITVSTFRDNDKKGIAPRALYKKFGFVEDELIEEFGYPNQIFILKP